MPIKDTVSDVFAVSFIFLFVSRLIPIAVELFSVQPDALLAMRTYPRGTPAERPSLRDVENIWHLQHNQFILEFVLFLPMQ